MAYDFTALSPADFEELSRDLLQAELGVRFESFAAGRDGGVDLRYAKTRKDNWIVQCKHYARSGWRLLIAQLKSEVAKVKKLEPARYILTASVELTPQNKSEILSLFDPWLASTSDILGADDMRNLLARHPNVERAHFKLWLASTAVLGRILNAASFARTEALRAEIERQVKLYVSNESFSRALDILSSNHVCIIAGPPGIGKTLLARMLMLHHLQQEYDGYVLSADIDEANQLYSPFHNQFFYYDDFLGTAFDESLTKNEDARLAEFMQRVSRASNKRLVLTTREYILRRMTSRYERLHQAIEERLRCIVQLEDYTRLVQGRLLYNHLFFSKIDASEINVFCAQRGYKEIVGHANFSPRLVEFATRHAETHRSPGRNLKTFMIDVLENPSILWDHAFKSQLSGSAQTVLLAMLFLPPATPLDDLIAATQSLAACRGEKAISGIEFAAHLKHLEGTFIAVDIPKRGSRSARYLSPAIADYLLSILQESPAEIDAAVKSSVFFEQVLSVWSASDTEDQDRSGKSITRFSQLSTWLQDHADTLLAAIGRTWRAPSCHWQERWVGGQWKLARKPISLESRLLEVLEMSSALHAPQLGAWAEARVGEISANWTKREGDRAAAAMLVGTFDVGADVRRKLRDWSIADIEDAEDFEAALRLRETAPDLVDDAFEARLAESFELFVQSQEQYILEEADDPASAESAMEEVELLAGRLGAPPAWDEDALRDHIHELEQRREDHFDPDVAREAHFGGRKGDLPAFETAALDTLFDSLGRAFGALE